MSPVGGVNVQTIESFPRVSGDEPRSAATCTHVWMFSPREWG